MMLLMTLWWLLFWTATGLCIGSFLNVVIYRIPRNVALSDPLWSFCPNCQHRIRWYDNLPLASYLLLGAKCRDCSVGIPPRYLIVEAAMGIITVLLVDIFFISDARITGGFHVTMNDRVIEAWPMMTAHLILFACLFSMSAIDIEHYWVDIRFTNVASLSGFVIHALWAQHGNVSGATPWPRPPVWLGAVSLTVLLALGVMWVWQMCQPEEDPEDFGLAPDAFDDGGFPPSFAAVDGEEAAYTTDVANQAAGEDVAPEECESSAQGGFSWFALVTMLMLVGLMTVAGLAANGVEVVPFDLRVGAVLLFFFLLIVQQSVVQRASDQHIVDAIEEESVSARSLAWRELAALLLPLAVGGLMVWLMWQGGHVSQQMTKLIQTEIRFFAFSTSWYEWMPMQGLATAASGFVVGGALGWFIRIFFTMMLGKEAFGSGDIHLMAAAGAIAGWEVALVGFIITSGLALVGWMCTLPFKQTRAIPLGPWLSLAFLTTVAWYKPIMGSRLFADAGEAIRLISGMAG